MCGHQFTRRVNCQMILAIVESMQASKLANQQTGLEKWLSGYERLLLLQRTWVRLPTLTWWFIAILTPVPGHLMASSCSPGHQVCMRYTYIKRGNTHTHGRNKSKRTSKKKFFLQPSLGNTTYKLNVKCLKVSPVGRLVYSVTINLTQLKNSKYLLLPSPCCLFKTHEVKRRL